MKQYAPLFLYGSLINFWILFLQTIGWMKDQFTSVHNLEKKLVFNENVQLVFFVFGSIFLLICDILIAYICKMLPTSSVYSHILTCIVRVIFGFTRLSFMNIISKIYRLWHTKIVGFSIGVRYKIFWRMQICMLKVSFTVKNNNRRFRKRVSGKYIFNAGKLHEKYVWKKNAKPRSFGEAKKRL